MSAVIQPRAVRCSPRVCNVSGGSSRGVTPHAAGAGICAHTEEENACGQAELQSVWGCPRVLPVQEIGAALGIGATAVDMRALVAGKRRLQPPDKVLKDLPPPLKRGA